MRLVTRAETREALGVELADLGELDGKVRDIERMIEKLDTVRRIEEIERSLEDEIAELRRLIG